MALQSILIFTAAALLIRLIGKGSLRGWLILAGSSLAIFWLQPEVPVRYADYWLPLLTLTLVVSGWLIVTPAEKRDWKTNWKAAAVMFGAAVLVTLSRLLTSFGVDIPFNPPPLIQAGMLLVGAGLILLAIELISRNATAVQQTSALPLTMVTLLLLAMIWIKMPALQQLLVGWLRGVSGQSTDLSRISNITLSWLGYSYLAFRLIHTLRDKQVKRLPECTLQEYAGYVLFFPSLAAGPIDRLQHFIGEYRKPPANPLEEDLLYSGRRLMVGLFKKFVLADALALFSLSAGNSAGLNSTGWAWIMVYAYALQIFFDFSGYTDIAIAAGRLMGFQLPENFNRPYLQDNLTLFWNNWHMSLTQWFRAYFFNPVTRSLRKSKPNMPAGLVIFITQVSTMVLIGLWHGITWNFILWGLWHGLGMFLQNRWSEWSKTRLAFFEKHPVWAKIRTFFGWALTFHFVAFGWVWFALPDLASSIRVFGWLFGAN